MAKLYKASGRESPYFYQQVRTDARFIPCHTHLADCLEEIRKRIKASGQLLLSRQDIDRELGKRRREDYR